MEHSLIPVLFVTVAIFININHATDEECATKQNEAKPCLIAGNRLLYDRSLLDFVHTASGNQSDTIEEDTYELPSIGPIRPLINFVKVTSLPVGGKGTVTWTRGGVGASFITLRLKSEEPTPLIIHVQIWGF